MRYSNKIQNLLCNTLQQVLFEVTSTLSIQKEESKLSSLKIGTGLVYF